MRATSLPLLGLLALSLVFTGCKKDKKEDPSPTALLTNKNWVLTAETVDPPLPFGGTTITDVYAQLSACSKDDISKFTTPNVYTVDQGATKCNASDPQTVTGTWVLSSDQKTVTTTDASGTISFTILSLTSSELKVKGAEIQGGVTYNVTATYTAR